MESLKARVLNGRYALAPRARVGGMADVFSATDLFSDHQKVAIKIFRSPAVEEDVVAESFRRETAALSELDHPNIVRLLDSGHDSETGAPFIVLEWLQEALPSAMKAQDATDWDSFYHDIGRPLLQALAFAHSRRISHRCWRSLKTDQEIGVVLAEN